MLKNNKISLGALLLCYALILGTVFIYYPKWEKPHVEATISWDVSGYYYYLPAIFIYKDLKQVAFRDDIHQKYRPASATYQVFQYANGNYVMKYSMGLALQYSPFFLIAHALAEPLGYPADGFSRPYQLAISMGSLLMALLGLWVLRHILLRYFSDGIAAVTLLTIVFATNYLNYSTIDGAMSHNWLFAIYTLLIWQSIRFYEQPSTWRGLLIGLTVGIAALTRPTEIISCLIPLFWGIDSWKAITERFRFFISREGIVPLLLAGISIAAMGSLQLMYWKYVSGDWIVYSYQDQGFSWLHPHVWEAMFSYRAGWLTYTPVMALALLGFIPLFLKKRSLFYISLIFSLLFMYITFAWDIWWYGGSLGQRAMVQAYPVLAIPLAAFFSLGEGRNWVKVLLLPILLFFSVYNLWVTHQAHKGGLYMTGKMTEPYFWAIFLKNDVSDETIKLLDTDELYQGKPIAYRTLFQENFEPDTIIDADPSLAIEGQQSFWMNKEVQLTPLYKVQLSPVDRGWVRMAATFRSQIKEYDDWKMTQLQAKFFQDEIVVKERIIRVYRLLEKDTTRRIHIDVSMPDAPFNAVGLQIWHAGTEKTLVVDELEIGTFIEEE